MHAYKKATNLYEDYEVNKDNKALTLYSIIIFHSAILVVSLPPKQQPINGDDHRLFIRTVKLSLFSGTLFQKSK